MKIAFLVGTFPSLSETFILDQITGLIECEHEVDIYALHRPAEDKVHHEVSAHRLLDRTTYFDIPNRRLARIGKAIYRAATGILVNPQAVLQALAMRRYGRGCSINLLYMLRAFLENGPYDIIHCHFGTIGRFGAQLKRAGIAGKLVVAFHGRDISQVPAEEGVDAYQDLFALADMMMPVSRYWEQKLVLMGADPNQIKVHRMGIDLEQFQYKARQLSEAGELRILTVARLVEKKGIAYAIEAVAHLRERRPDMKIRYDIVGDGPQHAELIQMLNDLGLEETVNLQGAGTREEVYRRIMDAHLFLLPSITDKSGDQEGIPVSLMEAMATGLPILSTVHTGIPELVKDGVSGFLAPERDSAGLAGRLEYLVEHPEIWPAMGRDGRARVAEMHDIRKLNRQLIESYQHLISRQGGAQ